MSGVPEQRETLKGTDAMISQGVQIKAARALLGMTRADLARRTGLHPNAVKYWEARTVSTRTPPPYAVRAMEEALEALGVVAFINPYPGVRLSTGDNFMAATTALQMPTGLSTLGVSAAGCEGQFHAYNNS